MLPFLAVFLGLLLLLGFLLLVTLPERLSRLDARVQELEAELRVLRRARADRRSSPPGAVAAAGPSPPEPAAQQYANATDANAANVAAAVERPAPADAASPSPIAFPPATPPPAARERRTADL